MVITNSHILHLLKKIFYILFYPSQANALYAAVKPGTEHAGATLEIPSEELLPKST
jgi:hypothetical protein